jgi:hypothetical protein
VIFPDICIGLFLLFVVLPVVLKLLGAILRALGPLIMLLVAGAIVLGLASLVFGVMSSLITGAFEFATGPVGLLLLLGGGGFLAYREWNKRQGTRRPTTETTEVYTSEKRKRGSSRLEIGDDGEIVTLDELLDDEDMPKRKRAD